MILFKNGGLNRIIKQEEEAEGGLLLILIRGVGRPLFLTMAPVIVQTDGKQTKGLGES